MNYDELLELLDIENPDEFQYFEHFADLMECDQPVSYDALFKLISQVDKVTLSELMESYFDEIADALPDDGTEAYTLLKSVGLSLRGLLKPIEDDDEYGHKQLVTFVEELERFRNWYTIDSNIKCTRKKDGITKEATFLEAVVLARIEKLNEEEYSYGFDDGLDYQLDEYMMSFGDIIEDDEEGYIEEELYEDAEEEYMRGMEEDEYEY
ncbi:hypothetical protein [Clostridium aminobutyricum]|uniref:Uncharacterized protein n=1 Tax=Clostridium aminobutyricum TaxID=33953 RepID=A0A939D7F3_CLOAM|nr:hypothetical protein [Clostridium aminobutyricum]MBN7772208.1 hypothetical protein [Clostridium aminobutyricum]